MHANWVQLKKKKRRHEDTARADHLKYLLGLWEGKKKWYATDVDGDAVMKESKLIGRVYPVLR